MPQSIELPYRPHNKQAEIHNHPARIKIVAAGRRFGKTMLAINELIRMALSHPQRDDLPIQRSWYICDTYKHAEMIAWRTFFKYCPHELIKLKNINKLQVELINGHVIEFKGSEDPDKLRGVALVFVVLDEYGHMKSEVWTDVIRASLVDMQGKALFIGTPGSDGSPHFQEMYELGRGLNSDYKSWLCHTIDNPTISPDEIEKARREMPKDIFEREFMASFSSTSGLIYDNFKHVTHVIPHYEPDQSDFIVGAIDPGLHNPTGALLCAWDKEGTGRIFKEYYQVGLLASENAERIKKLSEPYKIAYWVIDRASIRRDPASGLCVFDKFRDVLCPKGIGSKILTSPSDAQSVWAGIDQVKQLFHVDPVLGVPKLYVTAQCLKFLWEMGRYTRYRPRFHIEKNEEEKPRKLNDHLMDAIRYMVMTKPWIRTNMRYGWGMTPRQTGY